MVALETLGAQTRHHMRGVPEAFAKGKKPRNPFIVIPPEDGV